MYEIGTRILYRASPDVGKYIMLEVQSTRTSAMGDLFYCVSFSSRSGLIEVSSYFFERNDLDIVVYDDLSDKEQFLYEMTGKIS